MFNFKMQLNYMCAIWIEKVFRNHLYWSLMMEKIPNKRLWLCNLKAYISGYVCSLMNWEDELWPLVPAPILVYHYFTTKPKNKTTWYTCLKLLETQSTNLFIITVNLVLNVSVSMFQHHCRACGQVFCSQCSSRNCTLPKFGIEKEVRVCEACYNKVNKFVYNYISC